MLSVSDYNLIIDCFNGEKDRFHVFCFAKRSDYFDVIGTFEKREDAEKLKQVMLNNGGLLSSYKNYKSI